MALFQVQPGDGVCLPEVDSGVDEASAIDGQHMLKCSVTVPAQDKGIVIDGETTVELSF